MHTIRVPVPHVSAPDGDPETAALLRGAMQAREACAQIAEAWGSADLAQVLRNVKLTLEVRHE